MLSPQDIATCPTEEISRMLCPLLLLGNSLSSANRMAIFKIFEDRRRQFVKKSDTGDMWIAFTSAVAAANARAFKPKLC